MIYMFPAKKAVRAVALGHAARYLPSHQWLSHITTYMQDNVKLITDPVVGQ